jgi:hypothetical protein
MMRHACIWTFLDHVEMDTGKSDRSVSSSPFLLGTYFEMMFVLGGMGCSILIYSSFKLGATIYVRHSKRLLLVGIHPFVIFSCCIVGMMRMKVNVQILVYWIT